jgi:hypothetical protein
MVFNPTVEAPLKLILHDEFAKTNNIIENNMIVILFILQIQFFYLTI